MTCQTAPVKAGASHPFLVVTADPLTALALRAVADAVELLTTDRDEQFTVGTFEPNIRSGAAMAEFLAAACPAPAKRNRLAKDAGVSMYVVGPGAERVPVACLLEVLVYGAAG